MRRMHEKKAPSKALLSAEFNAHAWTVERDMTLQAPQPQSNRGCPSRGRVVGWLLALHLLLALGLQFAPTLHRDLHPDADSAEHDCMLTVLQTGSVELLPVSPPIATPAVFGPNIPARELQILLPALADRLLSGRAPPAFA